MRTILLILLLGTSALTLAQAPAGEQQPEVPEAAEPGSKEREAGEGAPGAAEQPEEARENGAGDAAEETPGLEEQEPGAATAAEAVEETLPPDPPEEGAPAEEEFQPDEEISEDYPVPLPSDI